MTSPLSAETRAALRGVKPAPPLFSNMVLAEEFDRTYRVGSYRLLPRTDGLFALIDESRPFGDRTVKAVRSTGEGYELLHELAERRRRAPRAA